MDQPAAPVPAAPPQGAPQPPVPPEVAAAINSAAATPAEVAAGLAPAAPAATPADVAPSPAPAAPAAPPAAAPPAPAPLAPAAPAEPAPAIAGNVVSEPAPATPPAQPAVPVGTAAPAPAPAVPMTPAAPETVTMPAGTATTAAPPAPEEVGADWPCVGYQGAQPFEVAKPPAITHDRGLIASGAAGDAVEELCAILARLGFGTSVSAGENPHSIYGEAERAAVRAFRAAFNVKEDPAIIAATVNDVVGPWTWEALFRLLHQVEQAA